tara:strand:+ start:209 stop:1414 length:1206 start_codon:yes stop_codon:yes gene_type:complete
MPTSKLSTLKIEKAIPPSSGRTELWDSQTRGLGLRITPSGTKTWVMMYRVDGKQRRLTLGRYPDLPLADARTEATKHLTTIAKGADPVELLETQKRDRIEKRSNRLDHVSEEFIERYAKPKNRSWQETQRILNREVIPHWGKRSVSDITRRDVISLIDDISDRAPFMANRTLSAVRRFFNWCVERDMLAINPAAGVKPPATEKSRDRVLSDDEIKNFWTGCDKLGWPFGPAFKLMLVTGQRRDEVAGMRWDDLNIENALWTLSRTQTKSDRLHEVPLSSLALEIIQSVPRTGEHVFTTNGRTPISGFSKAKRELDETSEVTDWRIHDLRRTVASAMARIGIAPHVIEKVLNHAGGQISGVAAIYNRHGYSDEKQRALEAWANALVASLERKCEPNVVQFRA